jgi:phage portal protein BeeE
MSVLACTKVISEDVAQVSRGLYKKRAGGGSDEVRDHPIAKLFLRRANEWQTGFEFLETLVIHCALAGRFVAFRNVVRGQVRELIPLLPNEVTPCMVEDAGRRRLVYRVTLKLAREAIGLSIATEESHALMHGNGAQTTGMYSVDGTLDDKQYKQLRDWIANSITGANKFKPFVLDRGGKWIQTAMSGVDAQHIETRKFQIGEVCRGMRVMTIMIGLDDKTTTFASAEQMFLAHVKYTLGAWFKRIEESIAANLLTDDEWAQGLYFKFRPVSLLRGSEKDRGDFYYRLWLMGALNANQIRDMEEMNPYVGGDVYRVPVNTAPTDADPNADDPLLKPGGDPGQNRRLNVGRVLSARNERRIRDADSMLNEVLAELDEEPKE